MLFKQIYKMHKINRTFKNKINFIPVSPIFTNSDRKYNTYFVRVLYNCTAHFYIILRV